ncbi:hypothetical protein [Melioribacter sp. OK-6-Me]|uniref:hypothetical protein n=1 Tax=unclassified Melioribacter TaxID=2627329 RepID=UPI003ED8D5C9
MHLSEIVNIIQTFCQQYTKPDLLREIRKNIEMLEKENIVEEKVNLDNAYNLVINTLMLIEQSLEGKMSLEDFLLLKIGKTVLEILNERFDGLEDEIDSEIQKMNQIYQKIEYERRIKGEFVDQINIENPNGYVLLNEFFQGEAVGMFEITHEQLFDVIDMYKEVKENIILNIEDNAFTNKELPLFGTTKFERQEDGSLTIYFNMPNSSLIAGLSDKERMIVCIDAGIFGFLKDNPQVNVYYQDSKIGSLKELLPRLNYFCVTRYNKVVCIIGDCINE